MRNHKLNTYGTFCNLFNKSLIVLYTFYKLSFSKDTFFKLRRMMLLLICVISFVYPFIDFPVWTDQGNHSVGKTLAVVYAKILSEISIYASVVFSGAENTCWVVETYLWIIYGIGIALLMLLRQWLRLTIVTMIRKKWQKWDTGEC